MTLNKAKKRGGGRKRVKRDGALKAQRVSIGIWGNSPAKKLEALILHRQSNLERAQHKRYHPAAVARYEREVKEAREQLEELIRAEMEEEDFQIALKARREAVVMENLLKLLKQRFDERRGVV